MDQAVFINDPDVVFCRESNMKLSEREKETVALGAALAASQLMFSDDAAHFVSGGAEEAFTERLVALLDMLGGREFGVRRLSSAEALGGHGYLKVLGRRAPDAYLLFSRDGAYRGVINLGDEPLAVAGDWDRAAAPLWDGRQPDGRFAGRSASLFQFEP
jgi:alpha-galactosidase